MKEYGNVFDECSTEWSIKKRCSYVILSEILTVILSLNLKCG